MKLKLYGSFFSALFIFFAFKLATQKASPPIEHSAASISPKTPSIVSTSDEARVSPLVSERAAKQHMKSQTSTTTVNPADLLLAQRPDAKSWLQAKGYMAPDRDIGADPDQLIAIAQAGDLWAQQKTAAILLTKREYKEAERWLKEAASQGSTKAILMLAETAMLKADQTSDDKQALLHRAGAWLALGESLGDPMCELAWSYFGLEKPDSAKEFFRQEQKRDMEELAEIGAKYGAMALETKPFPDDDRTVFQYLYQ